ncbi:hypothetical protein Tco_0175001 [Tanacetum coccineum]
MTVLTLEESLSMFMAKIAKRHDENTNLIKELRASTDFALRNQKASIKALEIQVRQMSIILGEKLSGNLQSSTVIKPRRNDETISTSVKVDKPSIRDIDASQYAETDGEKDLEGHYTNAKPLGKALPRKEKDPRSFTLPCFIKNMCYKALADLGASITNGIEDYPSFSDPDWKIHINDAYNLRFYNSIMKDKLEFKGKSIVGAFMNAPIFVGTLFIMTYFAVIKDMNHYRNEEMGDVIVGKEFCQEIGVKAKRSDGMITDYSGNESESEEDKMHGISHSYKKLKGFHKRVLNLGPDFIRVLSREEWLTDDIK